MTGTVSAVALKSMLQEGGELAILDVREEGAYAQAHLLFAVSLPLSRLELYIADLVPRRSARIVVCDAGDGLATRAAERLAEFEYSDVAVLDGGVDAWSAAGFVLFSGVHVPSKAFGEFVEHTSATPSIAPEELRQLMQDGADLVVLDSRPWNEYQSMNIPTGIDVPGAELVYRVHDIAPSPDTLVVVNCAGRTRSIIGAQSLINAGIPNRVVALRNGTMGWELAGFNCERGSDRRAPDISPDGRTLAQGAAARVARRFNVRAIDMPTLERWRAETDKRSLYLLDVRSPEEFVRGHYPGSVSAPGGQLVQATDRYVATLGARVALIDDNGVRATMTASWLLQMGWDNVVVLRGALNGGELQTGTVPRRVLGLDTAHAESIAVAELYELLAARQASVIDLSTSRDYRARHIPGAWFAVRSRLGKSLVSIPLQGSLVLTSEDGRLATLAATQVAGVVGVSVKVLDGGNRAWMEAGLDVASGEEQMADVADDVWLKPYERAAGIEAAMNEYLTWETDLLRHIKQDGTADFRCVPD
ncbi:MAG: rhodanese-like domain-containing protein [Gammaproteobacteria bacterium]|nr:rhodanese-like domain-containing protein [Gammaproteobacteria bacterium]